MLPLDKMQSLGKDNMDAAVRSLAALSNGAQSAALDTGDFIKRSVEEGTRAAERLLGARTVNAAVEIQAEFLRTSYASLVSQATRMGELGAATAREAFAPVEALVSRGRSV